MYIPLPSSLAPRTPKRQFETDIPQHCIDRATRPCDQLRRKRNRRLPTATDPQLWTVHAEIPRSRSRSAPESLCNDKLRVLSAQWRRSVHIGREYILFDEMERLWHWVLVLAVQCCDDRYAVLYV